MSYKSEIQERNQNKLEKMFEEQHVPMFIQRYFINLESKAGALNYWSVIRKLINWLIIEKVITKSDIAEIEPEDFLDVESEDVTAYLRQMEKNGISPTTLATTKNIFSSFWRYLKRTRKCPVKENIIESVAYKGIVNNQSNSIYKLPTQSQLAQMEWNINRKPDEFLRCRNLTIMRLLRGSGIREAELIGLDMEDIHLESDEFHQFIPYITILGKGHYREQERTDVNITRTAAEALKQWLEMRKEINSDAVFCGKDGKRLSARAISHMFEYYGNGITPHMMRHLNLNEVATASGSVAFAMRQAGHKNASTTETYYLNSSFGMKEIYENM